MAVPTTLEDLQGLLDDAGVMNRMVTPSLGEASSDDYFFLDNTYYSINYQYQQAYIWNLEDYIAPNDWSYAYLPVYNANYCLDMLNQISINDANKNVWDNVFGSALFFRSYSFLNLAWIYAKAYNKSTANSDLGVVLRETSDFNVPSVRSTVEETYSKVLSDAKESIKYLPDLPVHPMRPSKCAAYSLLARTYLSMREYDSAFKYADMALSVKDTIVDYNSADVNPGSSVPFKEFNPEIIFFSSMNTFIFPDMNIAQIDTALLTSYADGDMRRVVFFRQEGDYYKFKGSYDASGYYLFTGLSTDEMLLIRSECNAKANRLGNAADDLNQLRRKRWNKDYPFTPVAFTNVTDAIDTILSERRKELVMRGLRWPDIKRLNSEGAGIVIKRIVAGETFTLLPESNQYALPLPTDIISVTGMEQNPR